MNHLSTTIEVLDLLVPLEGHDRERVLRAVQAVVDMTVDEGGLRSSSEAPVKKQEGKVHVIATGTATLHPIASPAPKEKPPTAAPKARKPNEKGGASPRPCRADSRADSAAGTSAPADGTASDAIGPQQVRVHPLGRAQGPAGRGEALRVGDNVESVLRRGEPVIASSGGRRIGLYPSLDEALDRRHRHVCAVGTELHRIRDGALLARFVAVKKEG